MWDWFAINALTHLHVVHSFWKTMHFKGWKHTQLKKSSPINPAVFLLWDNVSSCSPSWPWTIIFLTLPCWGYRFVPLTTPSFSLVNLVTESLPGNFHLTGTWWKWMVCQGQRPRFVNGWWLLHKEPIRPEQLRPGQQNLPGGPQSECSVNAVWGRTGPGWWEGYCPLLLPLFPRASTNSCWKQTHGLGWIEESRC